MLSPTKKKPSCLSHEKLSVSAVFYLTQPKKQIIGLIEKPLAMFFEKNK